jgi:hypothetical protein
LDYVCSRCGKEHRVLYDEKYLKCCCGEEYNLPQIKVLFYTDAKLQQQDSCFHRGMKILRSIGYTDDELSSVDLSEIDWNDLESAIRLAILKISDKNHVSC